MIVRDVMTSPVETIAPEGRVQAALACLAERGFTALPVVDEDGQLLGIVTEADVLRDRVHHDVHSRELHDEVSETVPRVVADVMSTDVLTVDPWVDLADVEQLMRSTGFRSLPVVESDAGVVGIVSRRDLMRALDRTDAEIAADVRAELAAFAGRGRWDVRVADGIVVLGDPYEYPDEQHAAVVVAAGVPGVVDVRVVPAG